MSQGIPFLPKPDVLARMHEMRAAGDTFVAIGAAVGCSGKTARRVMGQPPMIRRQTSDADVAEARKMLAAGMSSAQVAAKLGMNASTVRRVWKGLRVKVVSKIVTTGDDCILRLWHEMKSVRGVAKAMRCGKDRIRRVLTAAGIYTGGSRNPITADDIRAIRMAYEGDALITHISQDMGRSIPTVRDVIEAEIKAGRLVHRGQKSEAACVAHREGGDRSPTAVLAPAPITCRRTLSLMARGLRREDAIYQARMGRS